MTKVMNIDFIGEEIDLEVFDAHMRQHSSYAGYSRYGDGQVRLVFVDDVPTERDMSEMMGLKDDYVVDQRVVRELAVRPKRFIEGSLRHDIKVKRESEPDLTPDPDDVLDEPK